MNSHWSHQVWGNDRLPTLLMVHGFLGSGKDWQTIANLLSNRVYCVAPDLPGHGAHTQRDHDETTTILTIANELIVWLKHQNMTPAIGLGYSLGGRVLLQAALAHPALFQALILESVNPGIENASDRKARAEWDIAKAKEHKNLGTKAFVDQWYEMDLFQSLRRDPLKLTQLKTKRYVNDTNRMARLQVALSPGTNPSLWSQLHRLDLPVLVLAGELDSKYVALGQRLGQLLPQGSFSQIKDAGHNTHFERPEEFLKRVGAFLSGWTAM